MTNTASSSASPAGSTDPARTPDRGATVADPDPHQGADDDRCPSCDARGAWRTSRRHRFSPFGSVTLVVFAFWAAVFGWLLDFGYMPAFVLLLLGVVLALSTRTAQVCEACSYVRPKRSP